ncbi:hypothetical protein VNO80_14953 [Phaseolus coccineus]|uniref:Uncharacterized protein n=1 Tax=Phaseolus coccineus TaxID=3886 RepID=A0AAN9MP35_PHACN
MLYHVLRFINYTWLCQIVSLVLSYGIAGAIVFRLRLILIGTATIQRFEAVNLLFAAILLYSSFKLFPSEEDESDLSDNFVVKACQKFIPVTSCTSIDCPYAQHVWIARNYKVLSCSVLFLE